MNLLPSNRHTAFDGQVTFETEPYITPLVLITIERIKAAIPDHPAFGDMERIFFADFQEMVSRTTNIVFALHENAPANLQRLQHFWNEASASRDYLVLWDLFIRTLDSDAVRSEWQKALDTTVPPELAAAPELATPLPTSEEALESIPYDSPFFTPGADSKENSLPPLPVKERLKKPVKA